MERDVTQTMRWEGYIGKRVDRRKKEWVELVRGGKRLPLEQTPFPDTQLWRQQRKK
jgi:hypothetical protein